MSTQQYHWEALRKQRVIDRRYAAQKQLLAEQQNADECEAEDLARSKLVSQQGDMERRRKLAEEVKTRDRQGIRNSYQEREERIQRLLSERQWHDSIINKMDSQQKDELLHDLLRDHSQKSKVLRDHGLYRGDSKFFTDAQYN